MFWATVDLAVDARVVFDIGAHLGKYTVAFARYVAHEGIVVAFEANPITAVALQEIVTLNGLDGAVRVVNRAVSDHLGQISFDPTGSAFDPGQTVYRQVAGKGHTVASTTVDEFVLEAGFRPDVLKIDVEGFELKVLQGASKTLMDSRPRISCEIHPQQLRDLGVTPDAVENFLASVGYRRVHGIVHRHNADDCNRPYNLLFEHE